MSRWRVRVVNWMWVGEDVVVDSVADFAREAEEGAGLNRRFGMVFLSF